MILITFSATPPPPSTTTTTTTTLRVPSSLLDHILIRCQGNDGLPSKLDCLALEKCFHFSMCSHHSYRAFLLYCRGCEKLLRGNFLFYGCNNIGRIMITHPSCDLEITFHIWNISKTYLLLLIKFHMNFEWIILILW